VTATYVSCWALNPMTRKLEPVASMLRFPARLAWGAVLCGALLAALAATELDSSLSRLLGEHFDDAALSSGAALPTWEALFAYLTERAGDRPSLLVLDEFPYLASAAPALTSILQKLWDHEWASTRLRVVLAGSYVTAMQRLEQSDQPLHGRRTAGITFAPFGSRELGGFVPGWDATDRMKLFGIVGNLPGHLALVEPDRSLGENVERLLLEPSGRLVDEAQHMLDAFLAEADVHYSILEAIAGGDRTWSGITRRVGRSGGAVSRPLQWLEAMDIIERVVPISERRPARSKRAVYRIADPYVDFWHTFVAPLLRSGSIGLASPRVLWDAKIEPRLDAYMGRVFEQICREHSRSSGVPFAPVRAGSWWDAKSDNEVDIVTVSADDDLFVAECKWGPVGLRHFDSLRARARLVAGELPDVRGIHYGLYSGRGEFDDAVRAAASSGEVRLFGPDDLV